MRTLHPRIHTRADQQGDHEEGGCGKGTRPLEAAFADALPCFHFGYVKFGSHGLRPFGEVRDARLRLQNALHLACEILVIEAQQTGVLANEALGEDASGKLVELLGFDGFEESGRDFEFARDLIQAKLAL